MTVEILDNLLKIASPVGGATKAITDVIDRVSLVSDFAESFQQRLNFNSLPNFDFNTNVALPDIQNVLPNLRENPVRGLADNLATAGQRQQTNFADIVNNVSKSVNKVKKTSETLTEIRENVGEAVQVKTQAIDRVGKLFDVSSHKNLANLANIKSIRNTRDITNTENIAENITNLANTVDISSLLTSKNKIYSLINSASSATENTLKEREMSRYSLSDNRFDSSSESFSDRVSSYSNSNNESIERVVHHEIKLLLPQGVSAVAGTGEKSNNGELILSFTDSQW